MNEYTEECLKTFLKNQGQLFDEPVAESLEDVRDYLEESGMDVSGMSDEEVEETAEVFALDDGTYLIVEG